MKDFLLCICSLEAFTIYFNVRFGIVFCIFVPSFSIVSFYCFFKLAPTVSCAWLCHSYHVNNVLYVNSLKGFTTCWRLKDFGLSRTHFWNWGIFLMRFSRFFSEKMWGQENAIIWISRHNNKYPYILRTKPKNRRQSLFKETS